MAYWDLTQLSGDSDFSSRVAACYADETGGIDDPYAWAFSHAWQVATSPGFADAYASAVAGDVPNPGRDPSVISDAQILSAVQPLIGSGNP